MPRGVELFALGVMIAGLGAYIDFGMWLSHPLVTTVFPLQVLMPQSVFATWSLPIF